MTTNAYVNIKFSLAYHMSLFTKVPTIYINPPVFTFGSFPNLTALNYFIAYSIEIQDSAPMQHTLLTYYITARKTSEHNEQLLLWCDEMQSQLREHFLNQHIYVRNFRAVVSDANWLTFAQTGALPSGAATALSNALKGTPLPGAIGTFEFHPMNFGKVTQPESPSVIESTATIDLIHVAADNISALNDPF